MKSKNSVWIVENVNRLIEQNDNRYSGADVDFFELLQQFTDVDFTTVSSILTNGIEKFLVEHGINPYSAIHYSWKWSD